MNPAPHKTERSRTCGSPLPAVALSNPLLDQLRSELAQQNHELDAASSWIAAVTDVKFSVQPELLEAIEAACTPYSAASLSLPPMSRC